MDFLIGGISVAALVFGIVEAAKGVGVQGKRSRVLALGLGFLFVGLAHGISEGLISASWIPYLEWGVTSLAGALAAMGYYDFLTKRVSWLKKK